jgi:hypothetical protein
MDIGPAFAQPLPHALKSGAFCSAGLRSHLDYKPDGIHGGNTECSPRQPEPGRIRQLRGRGHGLRLVGQTVGLCEGPSCSCPTSASSCCILRSGTDYLWASESRDNAETWSLPQPTRFTDNRTSPSGAAGGKNTTCGHAGSLSPAQPHVWRFPFRRRPDNNQHFQLADEQYKASMWGLTKTASTLSQHAWSRTVNTMLGIICKRPSRFARASIRFNRKEPTMPLYEVITDWAKSVKARRQEQPGRGSCAPFTGTNTCT